MNLFEGTTQIGHVIDTVPFKIIIMPVIRKMLNGSF